MNQKSKTRLFYGYIFFIFILLIFIYWLTPLKEILSPTELKLFKAWIKNLGWIAPWLYVVVYILGTILCVPATILSLLGGVAFPVFDGTVFALLGCMLGALMSFYIAKFLGKHWVEAYLTGSIEKMAENISSHGFTFVVWLRLFPFLPYSIQNYAFGLTRISLKDYMAGNFIGMLPWALGLVSLGDAATKISFTNPKIWMQPEIWGPILIVMLLLIFPKFLKMNRDMYRKFRRKI